MYSLILEASTVAGSIALLRGHALVHASDVTMGASREDSLFPAVQTLLANANVEVADLSAIVCGEGPGSFTSLRIAASIAKGLAQAANVPLYAVPSLLLSAATHDEPGEYVVHADALRGERYAMGVRVDADGMIWATSAVARLTSDELALFAGPRPRLSVLAAESAPLDIAVRPSAARISRVADWRTHGRVHLASWEPAYGRLAEAQVKWEATHHRPLTDDTRVDVASVDVAPATGGAA
jgi:tRNA threonylcarbamoyladenosine biosynthesis protein TsaB